jgi:hypothetical protein
MTHWRANDFTSHKSWNVSHHDEIWPSISAWCIRVFVIVGGLGICAYVVWVQ